MRSTVAIVGRPNVGKSTIFNRIVGEPSAIVDDIPGVTRDRLYGTGTWLNHTFNLIDTGGMSWDKEPMNQLIINQAEVAISEADVILFVVDGRVGVTNDDKRVAEKLRKSSKEVILAVNKVDNFNNDTSYEFYELSLGDPVPVSGIHGSNMGDLLDRLAEALPYKNEDEDEETQLKVSIIGKPNAGKSSLVNRLCGEDRVIVSNVAGTTRDSIDQIVKAYGKEYLFIDTAGLRKQSKVSELLEKYTAVKSVRSIERCNVVLMMIDATEGVTEQDTKIAGIAHESGKAIIIVVNKWDLIDKNSKTMKDFDEHIREKLAYLAYAPIIYISALTGQRIHEVYKMIDKVYENSKRKVDTPILNEIIREIVDFNPPPTDRGRRLKINYGTQVRIQPPTFLLFVNDVELMHFSYRRHIQNKFRVSFDFLGNPIRILIRNKKEK